MNKRMTLFMSVLSLGVLTDVYAVLRSQPRTGFSFAARKFYVSNEYKSDIKVRATLADGTIDEITVKPGEVGQFKWHFGVWNVEKVAVRPQIDSIFGRGSEDEITVPKWRQGEVWPSAHLTYKGLGDYNFSRRWRVRAPKSQVKQDVKAVDVKK